MYCLAIQAWAATIDILWAHCIAVTLHTNSMQPLSNSCASVFGSSRAKFKSSGLNATRLWRVEGMMSVKRHCCTCIELHLDQLAVQGQLRQVQAQHCHEGLVPLKGCNQWCCVLYALHSF